MTTRMRPVDQTVSSPVNGNCLEAAVASILGIPLDAVPDTNWHPDTWMDELAPFVRSHGFALLYSPDAELRPKGYHIACGKGPHAVVALDGEVVHCPHPSRAGMHMKPEWWILFLPLDRIAA